MILCARVYKTKQEDKMVNVFLFILMIVIVADTVIEYSLTRGYLLRDEFNKTLIWRLIATLLIMIAIAK